ncbi:hypothetical protein OG21DRAFT_1518414, partial [Imleria badia]
SYKNDSLPFELWSKYFSTMSSALQSALTNLQQNNYLSLAMLVAAAYDYVLTFSDEIEYIWTKPWTWVSTLFILVCIESPGTLSQRTGSSALL